MAIALIVAAAAALVSVEIVRRALAAHTEAARAEAAQARMLQILALFAPALSAAEHDPRAMLVWQPLARAARQICPDEFAALDRASGAPFPFSPERIEAAHARWTAEWLAWERTHDADYKRQAAVVEDELTRSGGSAVVRARLEAVEQEKLERYQRRYEEYVRTAKALQALGDR